MTREGNVIKVGQFRSSGGTINQSVNQSKFFCSGLSNLNHCEVHARSTRVLDGRIAAVGMFSNDV